MTAVKPTSVTTTLVRLATRWGFFCAIAAFASCTGKVSDLSGGAIGASSIQILTPILTGIQVGPVSTGIASAGGTAPLVFSVANGVLPSGLVLEPSTGVISGTIAQNLANQAYAMTIKVTDSAGLSATKSYSGTIASGSSSLSIASTQLSDFIAGIPYTYPMVAIGGIPPYIFSVDSGSIPTGVTVNQSTGLLSGTPVASLANQNYFFMIKVQDAAGQVATKIYNGLIYSSSASSFSIITASLPTPTAGSAYGASVGISGGTAPFSFSVLGSLPTGLSINTTSGLISGTVAYSAQGSAYVFTVRAQDNSGLSATQTYSGVVTTYATSLVPSSMPIAQPGQSYNATVSTVGGQSPFVYAITSGTLPAGLSLNTSTGTISGTVSQTEAGNSKTFTLRGTDANGINTTTNYTIVTASFSVSMTTASLVNAVESSSYTNSSTNLSATGGSAPYTYEYSGNLPTGVGLTSAGAFFGTPAVGTGALPSGTTYTIHVRARDALSQASAYVTLNLTVIISAPVVDSFTPTNAVLGSAYSYTITTSGGRAPYTYAVTTGSLPTGVSLSSGGVLTGIPTTTATCPAGQFTVRATDSLAQLSAARVKCITTVNGVALTNTTLPAIVIGANYNATLAAAGGSTPYVFSATGLPSGISLNASTGVMTGFTNASGGDYNVYFTVTDASSPALQSTRSFSMAVRNPLTLAGATLPRAATGIPYNSGSGYQITATGGQSPYSYSLVSGALPSGLSMSTSGLITGTPTYSTAANGGTYTIGVVATDFLGQSTTTTSLNIYVTVPPQLTDSVLPIANLNVPYAYDLKRVGGVNEFNGTAIATRYTWNVTGLPAGLTFGATTGRIYGTPTVSSGTPYTLTASVTDQHGFTSTKNVTLTVNATGKTLDLRTTRYSDPCSGQNNACGPEVFDIAKIVPNNIQQYLITARNDVTPKAIQIAKIESTGRVPLTNANPTSVNFSLPTSITGVNFIRSADFDHDGYMDIGFTDRYARVFCIAFNGGTIDSYGMPNAFTVTNTFCWPITSTDWVSTQNNQYNGPVDFYVKTDLRPDATNTGRADVIVSSGSNNVTSNGTSTSAKFHVLKNNCAPAGACNDSNVYSQSVTTTAGSNTVTINPTTGLKVGFPVYGQNLHAGTKVTNITGNTVTLSQVARTSGTAPVGWAQRAMLFDGFIAFNAAVTNASATITHSMGTLPLATANLPNGLFGLPIFGLGLGFITQSFTNYMPNVNSSNSVTLQYQLWNSTPQTANASATSASTVLTTPMMTQVTGTFTLNSNVFTCSTNPCNGTANQGIFPGQTIWVSNPADVGSIYNIHVVSVSGNQIVVSAPAAATSAAARTLTIFGPSAPSVFQVNTRNSLTVVMQVGTGYVATSKPPLPITGGAQANTNICPALVAGGAFKTNAAGAYVTTMRQRYNNTTQQCDGDFVNHDATDEYLLNHGANNYAYVRGLAVRDINNDNIDDMVLAISPSFTTVNSKVVRTLMPVGANAVFTSVNSVESQLQSRGAAVIAADKVIPYCIDGTNSCAYPAIAVTCGGLNSCLAVLPNQCSTPGCLTPYENLTATVRKDYSVPGSGMLREIMSLPLVSTGTLAPTGTTTSGSAVITGVSSTSGVQVGQSISGVNIPTYSYVTAFTGTTITLNNNAIGSGTVILNLPKVPTLNDLAWAGFDYTYNGINAAPYFIVLPRNGGSTTDPFKSSTALDGFNSNFLQLADMGPLRLRDANNDGILDLFAFSPGQGFVSSYVSYSSGGVDYNVGITPLTNYLNNGSLAGCPTEATSCYPDPIFNPMGVQQGYPMTALGNTATGNGNLNLSVSGQNTMDMADINNDNIPDVVVNGYSSRGVVVALGTTTGDFNPPALYDLGGSGTDLRPLSVVFSDLDQDGHQDIALIGISVAGTQTGMAAWFKGNGDGTFQSAVRIDQIVNSCTLPTSLMPVDIDLDGRPELSVVCFTNQAVFISRRHSNGTWVLQNGTTINSSGGLYGFAQRWGRLTTSSATGVDLVVAGADINNTFRIINNVSLSVTNTSTGAFSLTSSPSAYKAMNGFIADLEIADMNADGYGDVVAAAFRSSRDPANGVIQWNGPVYTCQSTGTGTCNMQGWGMSDLYAYSSLAVGDINNDGLPDLFLSALNAKFFYRSIVRTLNSSY